MHNVYIYYITNNLFNEATPYRRIYLKYVSHSIILLESIKIYTIVFPLKYKSTYFNSSKRQTSI